MAHDCINRSDDTDQESAFGAAPEALNQSDPEIGEPPAHGNLFAPAQDTSQFDGEYLYMTYIYSLK